jgi:hypothetical protein
MTTTTDMRSQTAEAVKETARTAAEASRRTLEGMQVAAQVGRTYFDESNQLARKLLGFWASGTEATLKAGFEMQNAALAASISYVDAVTGSRTFSQQWVTLAHEAQDAALEMFRMNVKSMEKVMIGALGAETPAK